MVARRKPAASRKPIVVPIADRLRWSLTETCAMTSLSPNYLRELERKDGFPSRVIVRTGPDDEGGKAQFVAAEVRAWAEGRDWRSMVAARQQVVVDAS